MNTRTEETSAMTQPTTYHVPVPTRVVACRIPRTLQQQFYAAAQQNNTTANAVLGALVQEYIRKQQEAK